MTPERLDAIRADVADVEWRAGRIAAWKAMPHPFAVESGLRTQGLRAPRLAADLRDLLAEVERLQAELLTAHRTWAERCSAWSDSVEEAEAQRDAAYRAGQEAMRERCAALCDDWEEATYCYDGTKACRLSMGPNQEEHHEPHDDDRHL